MAPPLRRSVTSVHPRLDTFSSALDAGRCEVDAARLYAFAGLREGFDAPRMHCEGESRNRLVFLRSRATGPLADLSWHVYEICDAHVHQLRMLDDALTHSGLASQLHPLTGSALHLAESEPAAPGRTGREAAELLSPLP
jgi:hypothetical protein